MTNPINMIFWRILREVKTRQSNCPFFILSKPKVDRRLSKISPLSSLVHSLAFMMPFNLLYLQLYFKYLLLRTFFGMYLYLRTKNRSKIID